MNDVNEILPALDLKVLQEKANEAAMKGAVKAIEDYYTGYDSPFKKNLTEELNKKKVNFALDLPDIVALVNKGLSAEIDRIANEALNGSYISQMKGLLTGAPAKVRMSDMLREFIEPNFESHEHDYECSVTEDEKYSWKNVKLTFKEKVYDLTFHSKGRHLKEDNDKPKVYQLLGMPRVNTHDSSYHPHEMTIERGDVKLKVPYTEDILQDPFLSYCANLVICNSEITIDTDYFEEEMFDQCNC